MSKQKRRRKATPQTGFKCLFGQPPKDLYGKASLYLCGRELEVENFRELLDYREDRVRIMLSRGVLTVVGDGLEIVALEKNRLRLQGTVLKTEISYDEQENQKGGTAK